MRVEVRDTLGAVVASSTKQVTVVLDSNPGSGLLAGSTTVAAVNGVATFADLSIDRPGVGYTLRATADSARAATSTPFDVHLRFAFIVAGQVHTCGLTLQGHAYCWGYNGSGRLGFAEGDNAKTRTPRPVQGGYTFASLVVGIAHSCGLTPAGAAFCWGADDVGQLGDSTNVSRATPAPVAGGHVFVSLAAGSGHTCGITAAGAAYCWGFNNYGQLGDSSTTPRYVPTPVAGGLIFTAITAQGVGDHTCGLTTDSLAYCWGRNSLGGLGDSTTTSRSAAVPVIGGLHFTALRAGALHTCGLVAGGAAYCWGANANGQVGAGSITPTSQLAPVPVTGGLLFTSLGPGSLHTCGVTASGTYCWGSNVTAQLGDGTQFDRDAPVPVGGSFNFALVSGGHIHTCAMTTDAMAYCWGDGANGKMGTGTEGGTYKTPVAVVQ